MIVGDGGAARRTDHPAGAFLRSVSAALEHLDEAQRLAGKLDAAANSKAGEALEAIKVATAK